MLAETLQPLRFSEEPADFRSLRSAGRTPVFYQSPEETGEVIAIVPDQPLDPNVRTHWQRDPLDLGRIIFAGPTGEPLASATLYPLSQSQANRVRYIISSEE